MEKTLFNLCRATIAVGAIMARLLGIAHQRSAAVGAKFWEIGISGICRAFRFLHSSDLRDDFSPFFNIYEISYVEVDGIHLVFVVEGSPLHDCSGQRNRVEVGHRSDGPGAPHLIVDAQELGESCFRLEFISSGPAWGFCCKSKLTLDIQFIDLDAYAVCGERKGLAAFIPAFYIFDDFLFALNCGGIFRHRKSPGSCGLNGFCMGFEREILSEEVV